MPENVHDQRIRAEWRARACAAAVASGASVFFFGAGVAIPINLNAAWLCALPAAALCAMTAARARGLLARRQDGRLPLWRAALLAAVMLGACLFLLCSMVSLCVQTLLPQARTITCALVTLLFLFLAALTRMQGVSRLCFALRLALPVSLLVCALPLLPGSSVSGLFPLLGRGAGSLALGAAAMAGATAPALMLLLPDLCAPDQAAHGVPVPGAGFFALRAGLGALVGAGLLVLPSLFGGYEALRQQTVWGMRLRLSAAGGGKQILWQTGLLLAQLCAAFLGAAALLCAAENALLCAAPRLKERRTGLILLSLLLALSLCGLTAWGYELALEAAPLLALPMLILLLPIRKQKERKDRP